MFANRIYYIPLNSKYLRIFANDTWYCYFCTMVSAVGGGSDAGTSRGGAGGGSSVGGPSRSASLASKSPAKEKAKSGSRDNSSVSMIIVGDDGAGKTSLITTFISGNWPATVQPVLAEVLLAPDDSTDNLALSITDTTSENKSDIVAKLAKSDVAIIVYDASLVGAFDRVRQHWLPLIVKTFSGPIVIVGNKIDLATSAGDSSTNRTEELQRQVKPVLAEFEQVDACLECSASTT